MPGIWRWHIFSALRNLSINFSRDTKRQFGWNAKKKKLNLPLLHTLLSSNCPLESLSLSSWRCKWCVSWWWWWWWLNAKLWCKWCKWLLLLLLLFAVALRSRGLCGDGDRPFSTWSRPKCNALPTFPPPPPRMSVIMKRERDGSTAIEPRCIGTVMPPTVLPPFDVNSSAELLMVAVLVGLSPDECHWSTILTEFYRHAIHKYRRPTFGEIMPTLTHSLNHPHTQTRTQDGKCKLENVTIERFRFVRKKRERKKNDGVAIKINYDFRVLCSS